MSLVAELAIRSRAGRGIGRRAGQLTGFEAQISAGADDAVEYLHTDEVVLDGGTLFLGFDNDVGLAEGLTLVALRFPGVTLAQGEAVSLSRLRFVSRNGNTTPVVLRVWCEAADDSAALTSTSGNLSGRAKTTAFYDWDVPPWAVNQDDEGTRTDELAPLVQEVINRAGWESGNALTFLVELSPENTDTESPRRRAYVYEADVNAAARVSINAIEATPPPPPPVSGDFSDGYDLFGLEGNEAFNPASPTLKDGTSITGDMLTTHDAARYYALNANATSGNWVEVSLPYNLGSSRSARPSRQGTNIHGSIMSVFRLTGDLTLLDRLVNAWDGLTFVTEWQDGDTKGLCSGEGDPWSPYEKVLNSATGDDRYYLDQHRMYTWITELAWALHRNRGKTSPGGVNYAARADYWIGRVVDYIKTWSEDTSACWAENYRGDQWNASRRRAPWGVWPVTMENAGSPAYSSIPLHRYIGLLGLNHEGSAASEIENPQGAIDMGQTLMNEGFIGNALIPCTRRDSSDATLVTMRSSWFKGGHANVNEATYQNYTAWMMIQSWLSGGYRTVETRLRMLQQARAFQDMHRALGSSISTSTSSTHKNLFGQDIGSKCGLGGLNGADITCLRQAQRGTAAMLVFEDESEGTPLYTHATKVQTDIAGGYSTPDSGMLAAAQFIKLALDAVGDLD